MRVFVRLRIDRPADFLAGCGEADQCLLSRLFDADDVEAHGDNAERLCRLFGVPYQSFCSYSLVVADADSMIDANNGEMVMRGSRADVLTFAMRVRPHAFSAPHLLPLVLSPDMRDVYRAIKPGFLAGFDAAHVHAWMQRTGISGKRRDAYRLRIEADCLLGLDENYLGNGLQRDPFSDSDQRFGAQHYLYFDRCPVNEASYRKRDTSTDQSLVSTVKLRHAPHAQ